MKKNYIKFPMLFLVLTIGITLGIQLDTIISNDTMRENLRKFNDVLNFTAKYYVEEVDSQKLVESAITGMLKELDPHTVYIPAKQQESVEEEFRGNFDGIGIEFQIVDDSITVVSPITGGPSEALGILAGDRIIKIDDKDCVGFSNSDVIKHLRGERGTKVTVSIYRPVINQTLNFEIVREKIPLYSVDVSLMYDNEIGYVSVSKFTETTTRELINALDTLNKRGMKKLVLDLRNNPGGLLSQATQVSDLFIDEEKLIVFTEGRRPEFNEKLLASRDYPFEKIPIVVLVNRGSASASEIVSGAIQDWDRGLLVGETTFGKGLVQKPFLLPDNSAVRITISKYFTPSGRGIQRDYADKKHYYSDIHNRDSLEQYVDKDTTKPIFKTDKGRTVFGGGGITPDYIVKVDTITSFTSKLRRNNIFYPFIRSYLDNNKTNFKEQYENDYFKFVKTFKFNENDISSFRQYVADKDLEFNEEQFKTDREYILKRLLAYIAREYWRNEGWYSALLGEDTQFQKAVTLFSEAENMLLSYYK